MELIYKDACTSVVSLQDANLEADQMMMVASNMSNSQ